MKKADVVKIRDSISPYTSAIRILFYCSNILENDKSFIIWDDDNEFVYSIRPNIDHYTQVQSPFVIMGAPYCEIVQIVGLYNNT